MTEGIFLKCQSVPKFAAFESPQALSASIPTPIGPLSPRGALDCVNSPKISVKLVYFCGRTESSAPTGYGGLENCGVGADDSVGPLGNCEFAVDFRKSGLFCQTDVGIGPTNRRTRPAEIQEREITPSAGRPRTIKLRRRSMR